MYVVFAIVDEKQLFKCRTKINKRSFYAKYKLYLLHSVRGSIEELRDI